MCRYKAAWIWQRLEKVPKARAWKPRAQRRPSSGPAMAISGSSGDRSSGDTGMSAARYGGLSTTASFLRFVLCCPW